MKASTEVEVITTSMQVDGTLEAASFMKASTAPIETALSMEAAVVASIFRGSLTYYGTAARHDVLHREVP